MALALYEKRRERNALHRPTPAELEMYTVSLLIDLGSKGKQGRWRLCLCAVCAADELTCSPPFLQGRPRAKPPA